MSASSNSHASAQKPYSPVLVTGATSQIGHFLLPRLVGAGFDVRAISRKDQAENAGAAPKVKWFNQNIAQGIDTTEIDRCSTLIHITSLYLLPDIIMNASQLGVKRIIAFSSVSVFVKKDSPSRVERETIRKIIEAEHQVQELCEGLSIEWTIFRPTLIYGCGLDKTVTTIANFIRRFGFFPVAGESRGLRQPVHAEDLAVACLSALDAPDTFDRSYNLSGGESLSYRNMVIKIFTGLGKKPRIISTPLPLLRFALRLIRLIPSYDYVTVEMADRMNGDICFDHADATRDFGYSPRGFTFE